MSSKAISGSTQLSPVDTAVHAVESGFTWAVQHPVEALTGAGAVLGGIYKFATGNGIVKVTPPVTIDPAQLIKNMFGSAQAKQGEQAMTDIFTHKLPAVWNQTTQESKPVEQQATQILPTIEQDVEAASQNPAVQDAEEIFTALTEPLIG